MDDLPTDPPEPPHIPDMTTRTARRLSEVIGNSQDILLTVSSAFPLGFFPDTITIDREKVTIVNRTFFRVAEIVSIRIEDVLNVTADVGPFFGAIKIHTRFFDANKHAVKYLRRTDALRTKRILQGYVVAVQKKIDCSAFSAVQLAGLLDELGQGSPSKDM